jgi:hypothetical protein
MSRRISISKPGFRDLAGLSPDAGIGVGSLVWDLPAVVVVE